MHSIRRYSLCLSFGLAIGYLLGWGDPCIAQVSSNKPSTGGAEFVIPDVEIPILERDALSGGVEEAVKLWLYYSFAHVDLQKYFYWLTIAAENGSPISQYNLGTLLSQGAAQKSIVMGVTISQDADQKGKMRARYWLKKAEQSGISGASEQLERLDKQSK